jgi:hypothetical protein
LTSAVSSFYQDLATPTVVIRSFLATESNLSAC